jgi:hypothetical protein
MILGLHALFNRLEAFEAGKAPSTVSDNTEMCFLIFLSLSTLISLQTNITHYTTAILLSTKLSAYKGSVAKNILLVCFPWPFCG